MKWFQVGLSVLDTLGQSQKNMNNITVVNNTTGKGRCQVFKPALEKVKEHETLLLMQAI